MARVAVANRVTIPVQQNLILRSDEFNHASWTQIALSALNANAAVAPDGTTTADQLVEDSAASAHMLSQSVAGGLIPNGGEYAWSVFAKAGARTWLLVDSCAGLSQSWFDLANGTLGSIAGSIRPVYRTIEAASLYFSGAPAGWYRCTIAGMSFESAFPQMELRMANADLSTGYTGDGTSDLFLWRAQLAEARNWAGVPTATTTTVVDTGPIRSKP